MRSCSPKGKAIPREQEGGVVKAFFFREERRGLGDHSGFSLIEVVISIVIFSIAVGGVMAAFGVALAPRNAPLPLQITTGTHYVQEKMEAVLADRRSLGFAQIHSGRYPSETLPGGYTRTTTVSPWSVNPDTDRFRQVTVRVVHDGRTVGEATTLVADY